MTEDLQPNQPLTNQPTMEAKYKCECEGCTVEMTTNSWDATAKLMEMHERAVHGVGMKIEKDSEDRREKQEEKKDKKRHEKRAQAKLPKFEDSETREEFRRKVNEFDTYSDRTDLTKEEKADDLYIAMSTPLKKKLLASSRVDKTSWKKTDPKVILEEMERVCLPQLNLVV